MKSFVILSSLALFASAQAATLGNMLKRSGVLIYDCAIPGTAALTFDDGPNDYQKIIGDTLAQYNAKGTFFVNGNTYHCIYDPKYAESVRYVFDQGHQIASHTWSHPDLTKLSDAEIHDEMCKIEDAILAITGAKVAYMRPPFAAYNDNVISVAKCRGQDVVIANFDAQDWNGLTPDQTNVLYDNFVATNPSTVLALQHETYNGTATEVLPYAIELLQSHGYKLVTVAECMGNEPYQWVQAPVSDLSSYKCT
ncbi:carbohydrate esterase family 4 protein [Serendipita vermifera MAFF 305830]|uniref:Carbohydrate esterase family 4 protein n=1 Tax=Serendipita vermifera MAFF 305830 TaxID=933852 RepID=A0A0C3AMK7_SERVB|nr:carbohydrate esterase family 4 protein [Serendipita vermifera MAFF 305830]